jgi:hypothetical protein
MAYFGAINPLIDVAEQEREEVTRRWLFSLVGAPTAPVREALFKKFQTTDRWFIRETSNAAFNIGVDDPAKRAGQADYLCTILESHFVLCPRGYGTGSFRLFETMRLGRAPVIISDDWVPPIGPDWTTCAIFVPERKIARLPDLLCERLPASAELGAEARRQWERWFAPDIFPERCLQAIHELHRQRRHEERAEFARWPAMIAAHEAPPPPVALHRRLARKLRAFTQR